MNFCKKLAFCSIISVITILNANADTLKVATEAFVNEKVSDDDSVIANGPTDKAPSGNQVKSALAKKQELLNSGTNGNVIINDTVSGANIVTAISANGQGTVTVTRGLQAGTAATANILNNTNGIAGVTINSAEREKIATVGQIQDYVSAQALSGGTQTVDNEMSDTSENAVQNKIIKSYVDNKFSNADTVIVNGVTTAAPSGYQVKSALDKKINALESDVATDNTILGHIVNVNDDGVVTTIRDAGTAATADVANTVIDSATRKDITMSDSNNENKLVTASQVRTYLDSQIPDLNGKENITNKVQEINATNSNSTDSYASVPAVVGYAQNKSDSYMAINTNGILTTHALFASEDMRNLNANKTGTAITTLDTAVKGNLDKIGTIDAAGITVITSVVNADEATIGTGVKTNLTDAVSAVSGAATTINNKLDNAITKMDSKQSALIPETSEDPDNYGFRTAGCGTQDTTTGKRIRCSLTTVTDESGVTRLKWEKLTARTAS